MDYKVIWEIDIKAKNPREAAEKAAEIQRDVTSVATIFQVYDENGESITVDLELEEEEG